MMYARLDGNVLSRMSAALAIVLGAVVISVARYALEAHTGFSMWDPGFLWYGVQRVMAGGVPVRDFMAYDPTRYYWAAWWMWLFDEQGFVALRAATCAFGALGLVCAGGIIRSAGDQASMRRWALVVFGMFVCAIWMVPWWKTYDVTASILLAGSLGYLLTHPSSKAFFGHGLVVGMIAMLGRNHGLYGVVAYLIAVPFFGFVREVRIHWVRRTLWWASGVVVGYLPLLALLAFDDKFAMQFLGRIEATLFVHESTNLAVPVPWPSLSDFHLPLAAMLKHLATGVWFVGLPLFCVLGLVVCVRIMRREGKISRPWFLACVATAVPYLNVAFSRADVSHLAQASLPCLIGLVIWPWSGKPHGHKAIMRVTTALLVLALTAMVALPLHQLYKKSRDGNWRMAKIGKDHVWVRPAVKRNTDRVERLSGRYLCQGDTLLAAPVMPGAYALLGLNAPVWEVYPLLWRTRSFQMNEISRLRKSAPPLVLINDVAVRGIQKTRYKNTHSYIWKYIQSHYHRIHEGPDRGHLKIYLIDEFQHADTCKKA